MLLLLPVIREGFLEEVISNLRPERWNRGQAGEGTRELFQAERTESSEKNVCTYG